MVPQLTTLTENALLVRLYGIRAVTAGEFPPPSNRHFENIRFDLYNVDAGETFTSL